jgi:hypothetical protein
MLNKNYRIKLRSKEDYKKLNAQYSTFSLLFTTSIFFNNDIEAILEDDYVLIRSKLKISAVTIGCLILLISFSFLIFSSSFEIEVKIMYPIVLVVTLNTITEFEHRTIEGQILKRLYEK